MFFGSVVSTVFCEYQMLLAHTLMKYRLYLVYSMKQINLEARLNETRFALITPRRHVFGKINNRGGLRASCRSRSCTLGGARHLGHAIENMV